MIEPVLGTCAVIMHRLAFGCTFGYNKSVLPLIVGCIMAKKLRLAVFISGTGRTLKNLIDRIRGEQLSAEIVVVVSSVANVVGLQYAPNPNMFLYFP